MVNQAPCQPAGSLTSGWMARLAASLSSLTRQSSLEAALASRSAFPLLPEEVPGRWGCSLVAAVDVEAAEPDSAPVAKSSRVESKVSRAPGTRATCKQHVPGSGFWEIRGPWQSGGCSACLDLALAPSPVPQKLLSMRTKSYNKP